MALTKDTVGKSDVLHHLPVEPARLGLAPLYYTVGASEGYFIGPVETRGACCEIRVPRSSLMGIVLVQITAVVDVKLQAQVSLLHVTLTL